MFGIYVSCVRIRMMNICIPYDGIRVVSRYVSFAEIRTGIVMFRMLKQ